MQDKNDSAFKKFIKIVCTKETFGLILILFSILALVCLITRDIVFFNIGLHISNFLLGFMGYFSFAFLLFLIVLGYALVTNKKFNIKNKGIKCSIVVFFLTFALIHTITARNFYFDTYAIYLSDCYNAGANGFSSATAGGLLFGLVMYWFTILLSNIGVYIILPLAIFATIFVFVRTSMPKEMNARAKKDRYAMKVGKLNIEGYKEYPIKNDQIKFPSYDENQQAMQTLFIRTDDFQMRSRHDKEPVQIKLMKNQEGSMIHAETSSTYMGTKQFNSREEVAKEPFSSDAIITKSALNPTKLTASAFLGNSVNNQNVSSEIRRRPQIDNFTIENDNSAESRARSYENNYTSIPDDSTPTISLSDMTVGDIRDLSNGESTEKEQSNSAGYTPMGIFDGVNDGRRRTSAEPERTNVPNLNSGFDNARSNETNQSNFGSSSYSRGEDLFSRASRESQPIIDESITSRSSFTPPETSSRSSFTTDFSKNESLNDDYDLFNDDANNDPEETHKPIQSNNGYAFRDMDHSSRKPAFNPNAKVEPVFQNIDKTPKQNEKKVPRCTAPFDAPYNAPPSSLLVDYPRTANNEDHENTCRIIEDFFEAYNVHGVQVDNYIAGPVITRYDMVVPRGIKISTIVGYEQDLERELCATTTGIRITTIPDSNKLGIEVPNKVRATVGLRGIIESPEFSNCKKDSKIFFAIGSDLVGNPIIDNIANAPHFLVAGTTGSGKSVCLDSIIVSMLYNYGPDELKLVIVDPKRVTFQSFLNLPHLLINEIIGDSKRTVAVLDWLINEMEARYIAMVELGVDNIRDYNAKAKAKGLERLTSIVLIIDEYGDIVMNLKKEIENKVLRLAQKARAAGIYMIIAVQKPVKEIITTSIKSNLPGRIALKVTGRTDSMVILDELGAEKLLGNGDMIYSAGDKRRCRYQGSYINIDEINDVINYIIKNNTANYDESIKNEIETAVNPPEEEEEDVGSTATMKMRPGGANDILFPQVLHLAIQEQTVSASRLQIAFGIGFQRAAKLVNALESAGYIEPPGPTTSKRRKVLVTKEVFEQLYGDFDNFNG